MIKISSYQNLDIDFFCKKDYIIRHIINLLTNYGGYMGNADGDRRRAFLLTGFWSCKSPLGLFIIK